MRFFLLARASYYLARATYCMWRVRYRMSRSRVRLTISRVRELLSGTREIHTDEGIYMKWTKRAVMSRVGANDLCITQRDLLLL